MKVMLSALHCKPAEVSYNHFMFIQQKGVCGHPPLEMIF